MWALGEPVRKRPWRRAARCHLACRPRAGTRPTRPKAGTQEASASSAQEEERPAGPPPPGGASSPSAPSRGPRRPPSARTRWTRIPPRRPPPALGSQLRSPRMETVMAANSDPPGYGDGRGNSTGGAGRRRAGRKAESSGATGALVQQEAALRWGWLVRESRAPRTGKLVVGSGAARSSRTGITHGGATGGAVSLRRAALPAPPCPRGRVRAGRGRGCPEREGERGRVEPAARSWGGTSCRELRPGAGGAPPSAWRAGCPQVGVRCWSFGSDLGASGQSRVLVRSRSLQVDARRARVEPGWREERCPCSVLGRVIPCRDTYTGVCKLTELRAVLAAGRSVWNFWVFISR